MDSDMDTGCLPDAGGAEVRGITHTRFPAGPSVIR